MIKHIKPDRLKYHNHRIAVCKVFTFDAAHALHEYHGKCVRVHGHTYKLEIAISGFPDEIGLVIDFASIKRIFQEKVNAVCDHQFLNDVLPPMNTSAENLLVWIWEQFEQELESVATYREREVRIEELILFETPTSYVKTNREWMNKK